MFTGLIDDVGRVERAADSPAGRELRIACGYDDVVVGESIAVNGACLTAREAGPGWFVVAAIISTRERTTVGDWRPGRRVNLERALRAGDRLGGHLVQGHVDGVARVAAMTHAGDARLVDLEVSAALAALVVRQGSVAVDGVSLTVNDLPAPELVQVALIDYTLRHTTLGDLVAGDRVHVEVDVIAKYVQRLVAPYAALGEP